MHHQFFSNTQPKNGMQSFSTMKLQTGIVGLPNVGKRYVFLLSFLQQEKHTQLILALIHHESRIFCTYTYSSICWCQVVKNWFCTNLFLYHIITLIIYIILDSTLFNAIVGSEAAQAANFPFCTIGKLTYVCTYINKFILNYIVAV